MKYLKVFTDFADKTEMLSDAEMGRLFRAMLKYALSGTEPNLNGNERFMWASAKLDIDKQRESYEEICATNKRIANSRSVTKRSKALRSVTKRNEASEDKEKEKEKYINPLTPLEGAIGEFRTYRKSMKAPLTDIAEKKLLSELQRLAGDNDEMKIKIMDQSIRNGWKGVFPLKDGFKKQSYEQHQVTDESLKHLLVDLDEEEI